MRHLRRPEDSCGSHCQQELDRGKDFADIKYGHSLTDELLISSRKSQHELRPRAQSKYVQGVHKLPKM